MLIDRVFSIIDATTHLEQTARAVLDHDPNCVLGHLQRAHAADPSNRAITLALARTYLKLNLPHETLAVLDHLSTLDRDATIMHTHALGLLGRESEAVRESLWLLDEEHVPDHARTRPRWDGGWLAGQTLIIHPSHACVAPGETYGIGFGDIIQLTQLCGVLADRDGVRILAAVPPQLTRLMATARGVAGVLPVEGDWPPSDVCASFWRLYFLLWRDGPSYGRVPYLCVPTDTRLVLPPAPDGMLRVGLALRTSHLHTEQERHLSAVALTPVFDTPGIAWYVIEPGPTATELQELGVPAHDLTNQLTDFAETARAVSQLDLIITVDTAVAHVAAALGKETWMVLPCPSNSRWEATRLDSAWYPTVRLFRQRVPDLWIHPVLEVRDRLQERLVTGLR